MSKFGRDELNKWLDEATNEDDVQAPTQTLHQIANAAYLSESQSRIETFINDKITNLKKWKKLLKVLNLVDFLLKSGPSESVQHIKSKQYELKTLQSFTQLQGTVDKGEPVRTKARNLVDLCTNDVFLIDERNKASHIIEKMNLGSLYNNKPKLNYNTMQELSMNKKPSYEGMGSDNLKKPKQKPTLVQSSTNLGSSVLEIAKKSWNGNRAQNSLLQNQYQQDHHIANSRQAQYNAQQANAANTVEQVTNLSGSGMFDGLNIKKKTSNTNSPTPANGSTENTPKKPQPKPFVKGQQSSPLPNPPITGKPSSSNNLHLLDPPKQIQDIFSFDNMDSFGNTDNIMNAGNGNPNSSDTMDLLGIEQIKFGGKDATSFAVPNEEDPNYQKPVDIGFGTGAAYSMNSFATKKKKTSMDKLIPIGGGSTSQPTTPNDPVKHTFAFSTLTGNNNNWYLDDESTKQGFDEKPVKVNINFNLDNLQFIDEAPEMSPSNGVTSPTFGFDNRFY